MKILLVVLFGIVLVLSVIIQNFKNKDIRWIPAIVTEWDYLMNLKKFPYRIDFDNIILPSGESKSIRGMDLYVVSGNRLKDLVLSGGRKLSLEDGDVIVVDPEIKSLGPYRAYLVNPELGSDMVGKESQFRTSDEVTAGKYKIIGAVIAKIPHDWIDKQRIN